MAVEKKHAACETWPLERYAKLSSVSMGTTNSQKPDWEYFNNSKEALELTLTASSHLMIHGGKTLLVSISLQSARMRGVTKGDSLLVIQSLKGTESRRFRMKFSPGLGMSGETRCRSCVERLSRHFPVKITDDQPDSQTVLTQEPSVLKGDVTLSQIAEAVTKTDMTSLPSAYHACSHGNSISSDELRTAIKLCLADSEFPAFVEQVEKELENIKSECS